MFAFGSLPQDPSETLEGVLSEEHIASQAGLFALARAGHAVLTLIETTAQRHGLTPAQFRLLMVLTFVHPEGASMSEVAAELGVRAPSLTELAASSEEFFVRSPSSSDRRQVILSATSEGRRRLEAALPDMAAFASSLRSGLTPDTWDQLIDLANHLFDTLEKQQP